MSNQFGAKALFRSALLMTGSTYVAYAAGLVTNTLIARNLGPADYGRYAYLVWLSGVLVVLMNNGLTTSVIRFVSECLGREDLEGAQRLHRWFRQRQLLSALGFGAVFIAVMPLLKPAGWEGDLTFFAVVALLASTAKAWYLFGISAAKGHGMFGVEAASISILSLVNLVAAGVMFWLGSGLNFYLLLFVLISIAHPLMAQVQLRRANVRTSRGPIDDELLARVRPHLYWTVMATFVWAFSNKSIETFLLNTLVSAEAVGFFTIAATLTRGGVELLSTGLTTVLMPSMANAYGSGGLERVARITADSARLFHFLGLLLAGVGLFWAEPVITAMYGAKFAPAATLLQVMVVIRGLTLSQGAVVTLFSVTDNQRVRAAESIVSVVLSATMALWLVPLYGLKGAIWAHAISTTLVYTFVIISMRVMLKIGLPYGDLFRTSLAASLGLLVSTGVVWLGDHSVGAQFVAGILYVPAYLGATLLLRVWHYTDLLMLDKVASRVPALRMLPVRLQRWVRAG
ncbi:MAG: oligosaccharide flippase family protein [Leptothrix sp. (in: b-proteobacteria)]